MHNAVGKVAIISNLTFLRIVENVNVYSMYNECFVTNANTANHIG